MTIHPQSDVQSRQIGDNTRIGQYCVVLQGAVIGSDCNLCANVFVENDVRIGDRVTVKSGVQLWDGVMIEDDVFIGPNVTFSNDPFPRSRHRPADYARTIVHKGASIGANATVLPGIRIGEHAMVAAGAVVTRNVPAYGIVIGNPARITGYVDTDNTHRLQASPHIPKSAGEKITELAGCFVHELPQIEDLRGNLSVVEFQKDVPFEVKRCFWVYGVPGREVRGEHAHFNCHQFVMCVAGSVQLVLDNGHERAQVSLDHPSLGVHIPPMKWGIQYKYSDDAVLVVFASHLYDAEDYIRDYGSFLHHVRQLRAA
jgi:acetyltransferase-like isoleucine patch superfamily enzyme/dTDP-4-dehydrorhamnose 3,5-epimerase-like enzyme